MRHPSWKAPLHAVLSLSLLWFAVGASAAPCPEGQLGNGVVCEPTGGFVQHEVGVQADPIYVYVVDLDRDGDLDILTTSSNHRSDYCSEIAWYRNEGRGSAFTKFVIWAADARKPVLAANGIVAADLDADGRLEVAVASGPTGKGVGGIYVFKSLLGPTGPWTRKVVFETSEQSFFKLYAVDMDRDGMLDLVVGGSKSAVIARNPWFSALAWRTVALNPGTGGCLFVADLNADGRPEIISTNTFSGKILWTEVKATPFGNLSSVDHLVAATPYPFDANVMDVNGDGRLDILASRIGGRGFHWFEQPATSPDQPWVEHMIAANFSATDIFPGDIDGDGDNDVLVAGLSMMEPQGLPPSLAWFELVNQGDPVVWKPHWVDYNNPTLTMPGDVQLADINGDGKLDAVTTSLKNNRVYWYENRLR